MYSAWPALSLNAQLSCTLLLTSAHDLVTLSVFSNTPGLAIGRPQAVLRDTAGKDLLHSVAFSFLL